MVTIQHRPRSDVAQIRARMRFRHSERADRFAPHHLRQPVAALGFRAEGMYVGCDQVAVDHEPGAGEPTARHLLEHDYVEEVVQSKPPVFLRNRAAEHACLTRFQPQLTRNNAVFFPLVVIRSYLALYERAYHFTELLVLRLEKASLKHAFCLQYDFG